MDQLVNLMESLSIDELKDGEKFVVNAGAKFYDEGNEDLQSAFKGINLAETKYIKMSGNSYGEGACKWIAENIF